METTRDYTAKIKWPFVVVFNLNDDPEETSSVIIKTKIPSGGYKEFHIYLKDLIDRARLNVRGSISDKEILTDIDAYFISSVASKSADKKTLAEACRSVLEGNVFNRKIFVPFYGLRPREE